MWIDNVAYSGDPQSNYELGDVNMDGNVTAADALLVIRYAMGLTDLTETQLALADLNGNGTVNTEDASLVLRAALTGGNQA